MQWEPSNASDRCISLHLLFSRASTWQLALLVEEIESSTQHSKHQGTHYHSHDDHTFALWLWQLFLCGGAVGSGVRTDCEGAEASGLAGVRYEGG